MEEDRGRREKEERKDVKDKKNIESQERLYRETKKNVSWGISKYSR